MKMSSAASILGKKSVLTRRKKMGAKAFRLHMATIGAKGRKARGKKEKK